MGIGSWLGRLFGISASDRPAPVDLSQFATMAEALEACGFAEVAAQVEAEKRPAVELVSAPDGEAGGIKVGGVPDLPIGEEWPSANGQSLSFIAQVDLAEIARVWPGTPLPKAGVLSFFYDAEQSVWGFDPKDADKWTVRFHDGEELRPATFPDDLPEEARYRERRLLPELRENSPDPLSLDLESLGLKRREIDEIFDICDPFLAGDDSIHKLFGHADPMQGPMEGECQLVLNGLYCGDETGINDPRSEKLLEDARQWKLLLQISTDDDAGMMWGDAGRIYFWIREQDLQNRDFDRVWLILQCA